MHTWSGRPPQFHRRRRARRTDAAGLLRLGDHGRRACAVVLDTGFDAAMAARAGASWCRPVEAGLRAIGIDPAAVQRRDHHATCITTMPAITSCFPRRAITCRTEEMALLHRPLPCATRALRAAFESRTCRPWSASCSADRVVFHDGDAELAPGITLHRVGGHTRGLQVVRVATRRGWVVLASDAAHFYANWRQRRPFPIVENVAAYLEAFGRIEALADSPRHVIPGHDPLVLTAIPGHCRTWRTSCGWICRSGRRPGRVTGRSMRAGGQSWNGLRSSVWVAWAPDGRAPDGRGTCASACSIPARPR